MASVAASLVFFFLVSQLPLALGGRYLSRQKESDSSVSNPFSGEDVSFGGPVECSKCHQLTNQIQKLLNSSEALDTVVNYVNNNTCDKIGDEGIQAECEQLTEEIILKLFGVLEGEATFDAICVRTHICPSSSNELLGMGSVDSMRVDPQECLACHLVIKLLKKKLQNPVYQEKLAEALDKLCTKMKTPKASDECKASVDEYLPIVFANVDDALDAKVLCKKAGFCAVSSSSDDTRLLPLQDPTLLSI